MIVLDASAVVLALLRDGESRRLLAGDSVICPHLVDVEVTNALRSHVLRDQISERDARLALAVWADVGIQRVAVIGLLDRMWQLRSNVTPYDAAYVSVAEAYGLALVTADGRLAGAPGPRCAITVVRS